MLREKRSFLPTIATLFLLIMFPEFISIPAFPRWQAPPPQDDKTVLKNKVTDLAEQVRGRDEELALRRAIISKQRFMLSTLVLFAALLAASLAILSIRQRARRKELKFDLIRSQQQALSLQMNPHFIFNTLGSLQSFILKNDRDAANLYLTKFSQLMRRMLNSLECQVVDLEEEIEVLRLYIELQHMRFDDHFEYEITVDPQLDLTSSRIPPFLIQPYVENAIHHGLLSAEKRGRLAVEVKRHEPCILWVVEDNGIGRAEARKIKGRSGQDVRPHGTEIAQRRIDLLNRISPDRFSVRTYDLENPQGKAAGTRVEILLEDQA